MISTNTTLSRLEALPAEIQIFVMCKLDSIKSLFTLLRASPPHLQIYCRNRDAIYTAVVCNQISAGLLPVVYTILELRDENLPEDTEMLVPFFERHNQNTKGYTLPHMPSVQDARRLMRFYNSVNELVEDATQNAIGLLRSRLKLPAPGATKLILSDSERLRVFRGFCNLEYISPICKQYLWARYWRKPIESDLLRILTLHLENLASHELQEIYFVFKYLRSRLSDFLSKAEDDRFEEFVRDGPSEGLYNWEAGDHDMFFSDAWHPALNDWMTAMVYSEGLNELCTLFNASTSEERLDSLEAFDTVTGGEHIEKEVDNVRKASALALSSPLLPPNWQSMFRLPPIDLSDCHFTETTDGPNLGLIWCCRDSGSPRPDFRSLNQAAATGLMIWDAQRLRDLGIFSNRPWQRFYENEYLLARRNRPSVESRARAVERKWLADGKLLSDRLMPG